MTRDAPVGERTRARLHGVGRTQPCSGPVHCLGPATFRFALTGPVTWHVPGGYQVSSGGGEAQAQARRGQQGGHRVRHRGRYRPSSRAWRAASADGQTAASQVADTPQPRRVLARRSALPPRLTHHPHRMDGRPAWPVRVALADLGGNGPTGLSGGGPVTHSPSRPTEDERNLGEHGRRTLRSACPERAPRSSGPGRSRTTKEGRATTGQIRGSPGQPGRRIRPFFAPPPEPRTDVCL